MLRPIVFNLGYAVESSEGYLKNLRFTHPRLLSKTPKSQSLPGVGPTHPYFFNPWMAIFNKTTQWTEVTMPDVRNLIKTGGQVMQHFRTWITEILQLGQVNTLEDHTVVQLLSHVQLFVTLWTTLSFTIYLSLLKLNVHGVCDATQPSHPLSSPSLPAFNLSQHQGLFQWVGSSHKVAKVLELQLQHQSFQWIFRVEFL